MKFPRVRWPGLLLASLTGVLIGSGAYTFDYAEGTSYLSNDPRACVNCHIMREQYDGWRHGSHHAVATSASAENDTSMFLRVVRGSTWATSWRR